MSKYANHVERWNKIQEKVEAVTPKKENRKYIYRTSKPEKNAMYWTVNIHIGGRENGTRINKSFTDKMNGGKASALLAAVAYRNNEIEKLGLVFEKGLKKQPFDKTKRGVVLYMKRNGGYEYLVWRCYWMEPIDGKQVRRSKTFSITKHGLKRGLQRAKAYRRNKLKELYS